MNLTLGFACVMHLRNNLKFDVRTFESNQIASFCEQSGVRSYSVLEGRSLTSTQFSKYLSTCQLSTYRCQVCPERLGLDSKKKAPHAGSPPGHQTCGGWDGSPEMGEVGALHGEANGLSVSAQPLSGL